MRILITGATGFIGGHLVEHLHRTGGHKLFGVSRQPTWPTGSRGLDGLATLRTSELSDRSALDSLLREVRPEGIFHLAGYANPRIETAEQERRCREDNVDATLALFDAIERAGLAPRIVFASTGHVYGSPDRFGEVCTEDSPLKPRGTYATSKRDAEELCVRRAEGGLDVVRVRLFNQIGPRQSKGFLVPDYASQIAECEAGLRTTIVKGDLSAFRDFTDVRDIVAALALLMASPKDTRGRVFNAASGRMSQIQDLVDRLVALSRVPIGIESRESTSILTGHTFARIDASALRDFTGWSPEVPMEQTLDDTFNYWRSVVAMAESNSGN